MVPFLELDLTNMNIHLREEKNCELLDVVYTKILE